MFKEALDFKKVDDKTFNVVIIDEDKINAYINEILDKIFMEFNKNISMGNKVYFYNKIFVNLVGVEFLRRFKIEKNKSYVLSINENNTRKNIIVRDNSLDDNNVINGILIDEFTIPLEKFKDMKVDNEAK